ncbi:MAG: hypothetical protein L0H41_17175 [Microlunatus sp.]|nr:hypothetical protein [Microlunatus sp.]
MPVRVDGATAPSETSTPRGGRNGRLAIIVLAVLVATVVGVVVGSLIVRATGSATPSDPAPPPPGQGPSTSSTQAPRVVEALPRSGVEAGGGGISNIYELRTGFPKTTDGAVQAAMNFLIVDVGPAYYHQSHYEAIQAYMFASPEARQKMGYSQATVDAMRAEYQVNDQGQPLTDGKPDPGKRIWDAVYLQYGAYRIVEASPTEVRVMMWGPYVYGVDAKDATSTTNLHIGWTLADITVNWVDGDWRQSGNKAYPASEVPKPADPRQVVTSFAERADLLGTDQGWTLPANAVETDTPELQLPGK